MSDEKEKGWIQTYSGGRLDPCDPDAIALDWTSISHHLSHICRYTGAPTKFYSVAEHSVRVCERAAELAKVAKLPAAQVLMIAKWGLIHDASEAFIADVSRPVKRRPMMAEYRAVEKKLQGAIARWAGLPEEEPALIKQADMEVYETEKRDILNGGPRPDWPASPYKPLPGRIKPWPITKGRKLWREAQRLLWEGTLVDFSR